MLAHCNVFNVFLGMGDPLADWMTPHTFSFFPRPSRCVCGPTAAHINVNNDNYSGWAFSIMGMKGSKQGFSTAYSSPCLLIVQTFSSPAHPR
jgi:hypothetical protein